MKGVWIGALIFGSLVLAVATKPSEADYKTKIDNAFQEARSETWKNGDYIDWAGVAVIDYSRSGKYTDNIIMSEYVLLVDGQVAMKCTGALGNISCG